MSHRPADEPSFDDFKATLRRVQVHAPLVETSEHVKIRESADKLVMLPTIDRAALAQALTDQDRVSRDMLRALGLVVGLSHERLTSELAAHLTDDERKDPSSVVEFLDEEFGLVQEVSAARARSYAWPDVLVARAGSRRTAGRANSRWPKRGGCARGCGARPRPSLRGSNSVSRSRGRRSL
ncbi:MAG: hypothetical protein ACRELC_05075 [Gemmatimonadota bacterium]